MSPISIDMDAMELQAEGTAEQLGEAVALQVFRVIATQAAEAMNDAEDRRAFLTSLFLHLVPVMEEQLGAGEAFSLLTRGADALNQMLVLRQIGPANLH